MDTENKQLAEEEIFNKHFDGDEMDDNELILKTKYNLKAEIMSAMQECSAQQNAVLIKEVDNLKAHIEFLEAQIFTLESTEADQIAELKQAGNKMAMLLIPIYKDTHLKEYSDAIANREKLNK